VRDQAGRNRARELFRRTASLRWHALHLHQRESEGRFTTAIYSGGGFMLLKRIVIERMIAAYPETCYRSAHAYSNAEADVNYSLSDCMIDKETGVYLSEDFAFCQRWRDIGGKIWLDTEGKLVHTGAYNFCGDPNARYASQISPGTFQCRGE
jgi:hypothetical protein